MPLSLATPEDYGAVGDGATNDEPALTAFFNDATRGIRNADDSVTVALSPNTAYAFTRPILIDCGTSGQWFRLRIYGNGARLVYTGPVNDPITRAPIEAAIQIGKFDTRAAVRKKAMRCHVTDLVIQSDVPIESGLRLDYGDFGLYQNIQVGGRYTDASIKIQSNNSLTFHDVNTSGADVGVRFFGHPTVVGDPGDPDDASNLTEQVTNVFHWHGGKVQQHRVGIVHNGTVFTLRDIDLSLCREWGIVSRGTSGRIACYFERIGPRQRDNDAGCIKLVGAKSITVGGRINCTNGALTSGTHAAYGVKCESGCEDIVVEGAGKLPQRMFVDTTPDCRNVIVARQASCLLPVPRENEDWEYPVPQPCPLDDVVRFRNLGAIFLKDKTDLTAPSSVARLNPSNRGTIFGRRDWLHRGTRVRAAGERGYIGTDRADVVSFLRGTSRLEATYMGWATSEVYRFEVRARLIDFHLTRGPSRALALAPPSFGTPPKKTTPLPLAGPAPPTRIAALDMQVRTSGDSSATKRVRLGPGWQDYWVDYAVPLGTARMGMTFTLRHLDGPWEGFDAAIDFLRVYRLSAAPAVVEGVRRGVLRAAGRGIWTPTT